MHILRDCGTMEGRLSAFLLVDGKGGATAFLMMRRKGDSAFPLWLGELFRRNRRFRERRVELRLSLREIDLASRER